MNILIKRWITTRQPYRVLGDKQSCTWVVVSVSIVIQSCFTVFILPLVTERTIIQRTSCEGTKFSVDVKLTFLSIKPRDFLVSLFPIGFRSKNSKRQGKYPCLYACALKL